MQTTEATNVDLRDSPQRWVLMALLVTGMIFCYAQRGALSVAAPFMIKQLNLSRGMMGILFSAFSWTYSFMQMPAGWLVDKFGVRRGYTYGFTLWSFASMLTGFARNLWSFMAARMLLGVGQATAFPASARAVSNWFKDRERGTVNAGYLTGVRLGQALINWAGALFLAVYSFQSFFLVIGIVPMLWLIPWSAFLKKWEVEDTDPGATTRRFKPGSGVSFYESLALFKQLSVFGIFLGFFAYDYAWFVYVYWLPSYLSLERKFTTVEMGLYSSVPFLAMSIVILLSGIVSDGLIRRGYSETAVRKTLIVIGLLIGCLIVPAGLVEDKMTAVWLLTISLCGLGISSPNCWALTQAVCSKRIVGTVSGIQNFGGNVGGILAPALTGFIAQASGSFALALGLSGVVLVIGILSYIFLIPRQVTSSESAG